MIKLIVIKVIIVNRGIFMIVVRKSIGQNFWARGYYVSTVGRDEVTIRRYIREQEAEDHRLDQLEMFKDK